MMTAPILEINWTFFLLLGGILISGGLLVYGALHIARASRRD